MRNRFNLNESEKNRIRGLHKINLISEQNTDFLEKSYVKPLADKGYVEVDTIDLPDGTYQKRGGGYRIDIQNEDGGATGYMVVTNNGIRGMWSGTIEIKGNNLPGDIGAYKIMYNEDLKKEPPQAGGAFDKQKLLYKAFDIGNIKIMSEEDINTIIEILKNYKGKLDLDSDKYGDVGAPFGL